MTQVKNEVAKKNITDHVLEKVKTMQEIGELKLPKDFSAENALKGAYLVLQDVKDKTGKSVLESCKTSTVANALFTMINLGLNPIKKQAYFVAYGDNLTLIPSYFGNIALTKRFADVKDIRAFEIYKGDEFEFEVDIQTGTKHVTKHKQKLEDMLPENVIGAYAVVFFNDGTTNTEVMNIAQIRKSWNMGATKGGSKAHTEFTGEMAKRTVINRACKLIVNSTSDAYVIDDNSVEYKPKSTSDIIDSTADEIKQDDIVEVDFLPENPTLEQVQALAEDGADF